MLDRLSIPLLLLASCAFAAEFEAASIKPAPPPKQVGSVSVHMHSSLSDGTLSFENVSLRDLLAQAYRLSQSQISGPDWLNDVRFDISAVFKPASTQEQFREMLQALLADRFALKFHRETKELPVYALTVNKGGHRLMAADGPPKSSSKGNNGVVHYEANTTMAGFVEFLSGRMDRPVLDRTGLTGAFEISLDFSNDDPLKASRNDATVPLLVTALPEQLGLRLDSTKGPVETLVVDSASKTPTEN
jgi:uncharacterized protein (TIGR03435 family)